jgi:hypothetical protein
MAIHINPIDPANAPIVRDGTTLPSTASLLRAVKTGSEALGGANNYAAQSTVQTRQNTEIVQKTDKMLSRKITTATLAALTPAADTHDEDEADREREQECFGSDYPYAAPDAKKSPAPKNVRKPNKPPKW